MQQCKVKIKKKHKERPQTEHQQRHQKGPNGAPGKVPKNTFGRQPVHSKVGQFRLSLSRCALCKKHTIRDHKRSTRETRGFAKTEHQQVQSESTNEAPESTIRDHKRSTRETRGFAQNGAPASPIREHKRSTRKYNQRPQTGAPERPEVLPKRSTSKSNQRAQMKHQKVQSETTKGAPENQQKKNVFF